MKIPNSLPIPDNQDIRNHWSTTDSTKLQCASRCLRKYFFEYILGWAPGSVSNHLIFGQGWHDALEHLYRTGFDKGELGIAYKKFLDRYRAHFPETTDSSYKGKTPLAVAAALIEYIDKYFTDPRDYKVLDAEISGVVPISSDRFMTVKMDLLAEYYNKIVVMEHKTGSVSGRTWDMQWDTSMQIGAYLHALSTIYAKDPAEAEIHINGTFFYVKDRRFIRIVQKRAGWAMMQWLHVVNDIYDRIEENFHILQECHAQETYLRAFPQNPTSCTDFGGCAYHDLCVNIANPLVYATPAIVNGQELPKISGFVYRWWNPLEALTNTKEAQDA